MDGDLENDADGAHATDRRFEQIVRRTAHNNCAVPIEQLETHDGAADEPPVASRSMYVGGKDAGDALGIVRWQRGEG